MDVNQVGRVFWVCVPAEWPAMTAEQIKTAASVDDRRRGRRMESIQDAESGLNEWEDLVR